MDRCRTWNAAIAIVLLTVTTVHAAPPGDAPQRIPGWRLPEAALDALWTALGWLLILP